MIKTIRLLLLFFVLNSVASEKVTFVEDPTPPFILGEMGEKPTGGISLKVIRAVFDQIPEAEPEFVELVPWKRSLKSVESGHIDAIIHILKTPEREKKYFYSAKTYSGRTMLFYSKKAFKDGFEWKTLDDLKGHKLCVQRGALSEQFLIKVMQKESFKLDVAGANQILHCLRMIEIGRRDIFIDNESVGYAMLEAMEMKNRFDVASKPLYSKDFYMAFSRNSNAHTLIPKINKALQKLRQDGEIEKFIKNRK